MQGRDLLATPVEICFGIVYSMVDLTRDIQNIDIVETDDWSLRHFRMKVEIYSFSGVDLSQSHIYWRLLAGMSLKHLHSNIYSRT